MCRNEIKPQTVRLQVFISIAMYPAIRQYDEQTFDDMSKESEKKTLSLRNRCGLLQVKALLSRPNKMANEDPSGLTWELTKDEALIKVN